MEIEEEKFYRLLANEYARGFTDGCSYEQKNQRDLAEIYRVKYVKCQFCDTTIEHRFLCHHCFYPVDSSGGCDS